MPREKARLVFVFFLLLYILTNSFRDTVVMPDEEYVLHVASALVTSRTVALPPNLPRYEGANRIGKDGRAYSVYSIGQSLVYAPFYRVARTAISFAQPYDAVAFGGDRVEYDTWLERETRHYLLLCPTIFAAISCAVFFLFGLRLGFAQRTAGVLTLLYGLGTMVWPYSKQLLTESLQNCLLLSSVYLLFVQRGEERVLKRTMAAAGAMVGLLVAVRPSLAVLLPILAAYTWYGGTVRKAWRVAAFFAVPMIALLIPQLVYDQFRFGGLLETGYDVSRFTTPLYAGLHGLLLSPGKSVFLYSPVLLLFFVSIRPFFSRARMEALLFVSILGVIPLKYAGWWVWSGNPAWGPRYLLVLIPFFLLPAGEWVERALSDGKILRKTVLAGLFAVSAAVQVLAISVHYLPYLDYVQRAASLVPPSRLVRARGPVDARIPLRDPYIETEFNPEYSPILGQWWMVRTLLSARPDPARTAPWRGLGFSELHADVPLRVKWDLWLANLLFRGLHWSDFKKILGALALLAVFSIVAQELYVSVFRASDSKSNYK